MSCKSCNPPRAKTLSGDCTQASTKRGRHAAQRPYTHRIEKIGLPSPGSAASERSCRGADRRSRSRSIPTRCRACSKRGLAIRPRVCAGWRLTVTGPSARPRSTRSSGSLPSQLAVQFETCPRNCCSTRISGNFGIVYGLEAAARNRCHQTMRSQLTIAILSSAGVSSISLCRAPRRHCSSNQSLSCADFRFPIPEDTAALKRLT